MSIFVSCGEVSGDLYASDLIQELLRALPREKLGKIWGVMGPRSVSAGGEATWSYEELKLMGITEVIPAIPRILKLRNRIAAEILRLAPSVVVVVDSPDFHFSLVKKLRRSGYKGLTVFLVTPTVWAWRSGRTKLLRDYFDLCLPLFSFEHEFLTARGVHSRWTAHPLVETLEGYTPPPELANRYRNTRVIALMAGSRRYDIQYHLTQLIDTAKLLRAGGSGLLPVFSVAPGLSDTLKRELKERVGNYDYWEGEGRGLMSVAAAVVGVSGTVAVEAMLLRRFMVVIYNGRGLSWLIARALVRIPYISIPNYLAGGYRGGDFSKTAAPVYPEYLKGAIRSARIVRDLYDYLGDPARKMKVDQRLETARSAMGTARAAVFWARAIAEAIENKTKKEDQS
jgi:lipid-A-disaccharide synthase